LATKQRPEKTKITCTEPMLHSQTLYLAICT
jgi:hypothetical protein